MILHQRTLKSGGLPRWALALGMALAVATVGGVAEPSLAASEPCQEPIASLFICLIEIEAVYDDNGTPLEGITATIQVSTLFPWPEILDVSIKDSDGYIFGSAWMLFDESAGFPGSVTGPVLKPGGATVDPVTNVIRLEFEDADNEVSVDYQVRKINSAASEDGVVVTQTYTITNKKSSSQFLRVFSVNDLDTNHFSELDTGWATEYTMAQASFGTVTSVIGVTTVADGSAEPDGVEVHAREAVPACEVDDEPGAAACDGVCDVNDELGSPDCDGICHAGDDQEGPDCNSDGSSSAISCGFYEEIVYGFVDNCSIQTTPQDRLLNIDEEEWTFEAPEGPADVETAYSWDLALTTGAPSFSVTTETYIYLTSSLPAAWPKAALPDRVDREFAAYLPEPSSGLMQVAAVASLVAVLRRRRLRARTPAAP